MQKVNQPPTKINNTGITVDVSSGKALFLSDVEEHKCRFLFLNRVIDRSLSAMNGCKGEGGKNPELQVTDHGSDTACMQTGRGRKKNYIGLEKHTQKNK